MTRHFWVLVHRCAGLFMAAFLILIGLTGSIIVFNPELGNWLDPLPKIVPRPGPTLDVFTLRERAQALVPHGLVNSMLLRLKRDEAYAVLVEPRIDPVTGKPYVLGFNNMQLDPYTGSELRRENATGEIWPITRQNVMTLVNRLHYQLAIPGNVGTWLFGIVALVWTVDCLVGAYLTFPVGVRREEPGVVPPATRPVRRSWLARWWNPAWLVKWRGSAIRINFDLHRAGGLWVWILLLAIAWSSVGFNLADQVYTPVMKVAFGMLDSFGNDLPSTAAPRPDPPLDWRAAHAIARRLMSEQARTRGFSVAFEDTFMYLPDKDAYLYLVHSDRDVVDSGAATALLFDTHGKQLRLSLPTGDNVGSTLHTWIFAMHMAQIWGLPYRIFLSTVGVLTAMLSITGVYIWWRKRLAHRVTRARPAQRAAEVPN